MRVERQIIIGMIISTDYLKNINKIWDISYLQSSPAKIICSWCIEYFNQYGQAPMRDIESIFYDKLSHNQINKDDAEEFEEDILPGLSDEYERSEKFNSKYLFDKTIQYFKERKIKQHNEQVQQLVDEGKHEEAEQLAQSYVPTKVDEINTGLDLASNEALDRVEQAFDQELTRTIEYPGALGEMWNDQLTRGSLVGFLAPEKRGKTFTLIELAIRGVRQKCNVAFFQAGDMTEGQQLKRIATYISKRSDNLRYCQEHYQPVGDCEYNQFDTCDRKDRNCDFGILDSETDITKITFNDLKALYEQYSDYQPCDSHTCNERKGTVWLTKVPSKAPLTGKDARKKMKNYFRKYKRQFKLASYPSRTLTLSEISKCLQNWEQQDGFVPDVVIVDYADLMDANINEHRHKQDYIWQGLRSVSQERHCLVITATQADARSYSSNRLGLSNFSEDKRKYAHVTAMYGLNQDPKGVEKKLGILRINELVIREGEFSNDNEVTVLQDLYQGRPFLESYA